MAQQIQIRRDTAANWTSNNPTLASGEMGKETDTNKYKWGDGTTAWNSLAYFTIDDASTTVKGKVELAIASEVDTGTSAVLAVTPDALAGANIGIRYVQITCFDYATNTAIGDGKGYFHVPPALNGMNLVYVHAKVITAGTTNTTDIQIANVTDSVDMLSTKITIDSGETGSDTAATAAVIDTTKDDVATNDLLRIDVDAISTTAAKGLIITMGFALP